MRKHKVNTRKLAWAREYRPSLKPIIGKLQHPKPKLESYHVIDLFITSSFTGEEKTNKPKPKPKPKPKFGPPELINNPRFREIFGDPKKPMYETREGENVD